jgi:hypothetical protein
LAIHVRCLKNIRIGKTQFTKPCPGQAFSEQTTDTPDAGDSDGFASQSFELLLCEHPQIPL